MFLISTNLLQAIDKECVHSDWGDYIFVGQDELQLWICGPNLYHNIVYSHYLGNLACLHVVQDRFRAHSTPRMAFREEGEDDEDMTSMHTIIFAGWNEGWQDQHWFPRREGGPKLILFESPRWRPKSSSSLPRCPGPACTKNDAKAAYRVRFGRSLYGWKDNFNELPMAPVSGPNLLSVNGNHQNNMTSRICQGAAPPSFGLLSHVPCRAKWPKWWMPPWPPPATLGCILGYKLSSRCLKWLGFV